MKKCIAFIKKETVLSAALLLAVISSCLVPPDKEYLGYIDWRTLSVLFGLMAVMAGLQKVGLFRYIAEKLLGRVHKLRFLILILVMLCFFFSMLITNDVALITFVPFTFTVLHLLKERGEKLIIPIVVMQTAAANLGSMLTPVGNPQNLYLYGQSGLHIGEFLQLMLPYTATAFVMLMAWSFWQGKGEKQGAGLTVVFEQTTDLTKEKPRLIVYLLLFFVCLFTVIRVLPYGIMLIIVAAVLLLTDREIFARVDYSLLLTFAGFFVFIGNMGRIEPFRQFLERIIHGNEVITAVISSQIISNVPAALLLSGFSREYSSLIIGTNLGGLGTLIASMASLISFKYIGQENKNLRGRYLGYFTIVNVVFLAVLLAVYFMI